jgi:hypothetical protein
MHAQTRPRDHPYVWVTWLTKLLTGECHCTWSAWHKAHFYFAKMPSDFNLGSWQLEHTALLQQAIKHYADQGYQVLVEEQNSFTMKGKVGSLAGKPDLIATNGQSHWLIDAKTGQAKASDRVQVMLYMWAIPICLPRFKGQRFDGAVVYQNHRQIITADEIERTNPRRSPVSVSVSIAP